MNEEFEIDLSNYYGTVGFRKEDNKYSMFLNNWDEESELEIPRELYEIAKATFTNTTIKR